MDAVLCFPLEFGASPNTLAYLQYRSQNNQWVAR